MEPQVIGRRARNKAAKRAAIAGAAARLFEQHGYSGTTTQQVARVADVAEGTVFRYAGTKQELLLMVINDHLKPLVEAKPTSQLGVEAQILATLEPVIELARSQPDNAAPYLREVLFGEDGPHRSAALDLISQLRRRVSETIAPYADRFDGMDLEEAASWIFSALVSELLRDTIGEGAADPQAALAARVRVLLRGLRVPAEDH